MSHLVPLGLALSLSLVACDTGPKAPQHRQASPERDGECRDAALPKAYFYAAENRTDYRPDNPFHDGCELLVPDHLFCCPSAALP